MSIPTCPESGTGRILTLPPNATSLERGCVPSTSRSALKSSAAAGVFQQVTHASLRRLVFDTAALRGQCQDVPPGTIRPERGLLSGRNCFKLAGFEQR